MEDENGKFGHYSSIENKAKSDSMEKKYKNKINELKYRHSSSESHGNKKYHKLGDLSYSSDGRMYDALFGPTSWISHEANIEHESFAAKDQNDETEKNEKLPFDEVINSINNEIKRFS